MVSQMTWSRDRLEQILSAWRGKRVLVVGDVGIDRYTHGVVERISPEAPVAIVRVEAERHKLGLAANVADNIRVLGGDPWLAGMVGDDRAADDFKKLLRTQRIASTHLVIDAKSRTVLKERIVTDSQQLLRVDYESPHPVSAKVQATLLARVKRLITRCDAVILEDYAKGLLTPAMTRAICAEAKRQKKIVAVDPNLRHAVEYYRGATVLTPNTREAEKLAGFAITDDKSLIEAGRKILKASGSRHVVITRGKDGMAVFSRDNRQVKIVPTYAREVYDVSGAGDTVISVLTLALASGATIEEAAVLGNFAGGVEVGKRGTATVTPDEIRDAMDSVSI